MSLAPKGMKVDRIQWRVKGFEALRRDPRVLADLQRRAERVAAAAGDGFVARAGQGKTRARAAVIAASMKARRRNSRDNTLLRSLDAGR